MAYLLADASATSEFYYKQAYLDYDHLICDGFYHVRKKFTRLPSLAELEANPQLSSGQVAMLIDRSRDQPLMAIESVVREELPKLRSGAERAALLANVICEAFGNYMGAATDDAQVPTLEQLRGVFGNGPLPVGELVAAGMGGARSRSIAFKAIADALPSHHSLPTRLVRAPYPVTLTRELQLHAWNDVRADGREYVVDLMDDAGALYEKASAPAAEYESLGREGTLLLKLLAAGVDRIPAGQLSIRVSDIIWEGMLGKGPAAEVYKIVISSGHTLAVKRVTDDQLTNGSKQLFEEKVSALAALDHPNIVRLLGACFTRNDIFIATEYVDGGRLADMLSSSRELSVANRLEIALSIATGLSYLHEATPSVVHGNLNSNNIYLGTDDSVKLADFGSLVLATEAFETIDIDSSKDSQQLSLRYAAPEVLDGNSPLERSDVYALGMLLNEIFSGDVPWAETPLPQIRGLVLSQKRPTIAAGAHFGAAALIQWCWAHKPARRPTMAVALEELFNVAYNYLWDASGKHTLGIADLKMLNAVITPHNSGKQAPSKRAAQRQEFAAKALAHLAEHDTDISASAAVVSSGGVAALLALLESGNVSGKEAAADALGVLISMSSGEPRQREVMRDQVLPALVQQLGSISHDGCRCAILTGLTKLTSSPGTADFRAALLSAGGISALVRALQEGNLKAKAAASRLLLLFAAEDSNSQEWIAAAPGAVAALVDLCRSSDAEAIASAARTLIILADIPHTRQDALAAGAITAVMRVLAPCFDDVVNDNVELAAVLLSKYAVEPEAHSQIAAAGAIPILGRGIPVARDAGREKMLVGVLRALGAVSERSSANASRVIASRGMVPAFQLLNSRLPAVRQAAAFTLGCLFSNEASAADAAELTNIEGRLVHFLMDLVERGHEHDQAYGAVMLARVLTSSGNAPHLARDVMGNRAVLGALLAMLGSPDTSVRLAAVQALAKVTWLGVGLPQDTGGLADAFLEKDTERVQAIRNLMDMLESVDELTRYTAAKILISMWTAAESYQDEIVRSGAESTSLAFSETLQMAGGGASRADVLELCAAVLNVKSGPSVLEAVQLCPDWATFFWSPDREAVRTARRSRQRSANSRN